MFYFSDCSTRKCRGHNQGTKSRSPSYVYHTRVCFITIRTSCKLHTFRVDTHLCKLRDTPGLSCLMNPDLPIDCWPLYSAPNLTTLLQPPTSHHITSHHITSRHITSHHITSHHITSHQHNFPRPKQTKCPQPSVKYRLSHTLNPYYLYELHGLFYTNISRTSAVSSTNFGSILIFASCVVGTCNILCG